MHVAHGLQTRSALCRRSAMFNVGHLFEKAVQDFQTVAALAALARRLDERAVVMMSRRVLERGRRVVLHRDLDAALALMGVADAVVEAKLHFLFDVAGEIVGSYPARVDIEGGLAIVGMPVNDLQ